MIGRALGWLATGADRPLQGTATEIARRYRSLRWLTFLSITFGYGTFYVTRLSLAVAKKPLLDSGQLSPADLGLIGSAMLLAYAVGKAFNGFLADRAHIGRFMGLGLLLSATCNLLFGFSGPLAWLVLLWGLNGWFQSMGGAPSVVNIAHWFGRREQGTRYSIWSISHSLGEGLTYSGTALLVAYLGWSAGFWGPGVLGLFVGCALFFTVLDRPATHGLPPVAEFEGEVGQGQAARGNGKQHATLRQQLQVLRLPAVWVLGLASAMLYVARYGLNSWLVLYLQEAKGYELVDAGISTSLLSLVGILGTAAAGPLSDLFFRSRRLPVLLVYEVLLLSSMIGLYLVPAGHVTWDRVLVSLAGFGTGGMLVFLGGLMAMDLVPREATGATMGFVGLFSYIGAALQDVVSGLLIEASRVVLPGGRVHYSFDHAFLVWIGAAAMALLLSLSLHYVRMVPPAQTPLPTGQPRSGHR